MKLNNNPDKNYNKHQLDIGIKIEMEHTKDKKIAKSIAKDHLDEHTDYYKELVKMEKKLDNKG